MVDAKTNGLVLSGGGARGAYEVGVMRYVREELPKRLGRQIPFDVITGTSVGALNGTFFAATAEDPAGQAKRLGAAWQGLLLEELIGLTSRDLFRAGKMLFGKAPPPPAPGTYRYGGLLNTDGLERFVFNTIPWRGIRKNLRSGALGSLALAATHVGTGHTVIFLDSKKDIPRWSRNPFIRPVRAAISPRHALASAAIPVLFPAVKVGKAFYVDGGLRNNTPMSPAIRLGADRLLVVSLRHKSTRDEAIHKAKVHEADYPKPLFLLGKALNSLLLDSTEYDLDRLLRVNEILEAGTRAFGSEFADIIAPPEKRASPMRPLQAVHIQPSEDVGEMASALVRRGGPRLKGKVARNLIRRVAGNEGTNEADMLSYLLFDGDFAAQLIELGWQDARDQEEELLRVFGDS